MVSSLTGWSTSRSVASSTPGSMRYACKTSSTSDNSCSMLYLLIVDMTTAPVALGAVPEAEHTHSGPAPRGRPPGCPVRQPEPRYSTFVTAEATPGRCDEPGAVDPRTETALLNLATQCLAAELAPRQLPCMVGFERSLGVFLHRVAVLRRDSGRRLDLNREAPLELLGVSVDASTGGVSIVPVRLMLG